MFSSGQLELCRYHHKLFPSRYVLYAWQIMHLAFNVIDVVGAKLLPCFCLIFLTQITVMKNTKLLICYSISSDMESDTSLQYVLKHSGLKWDCPSGQLSGGYLNSSCSSSILIFFFFFKLINYVFSAFLEECFLSTPCSVKFVIMKKTPFAESNCATHIVLIATKVVY